MMSKSRLLAASAATLAALGVGAAPSLASGQRPLAAATGPTPAQLAKIDSTPLGTAIEQEGTLIRQNVQTGTPALDRKAVTELTANHGACEKAVSAVAAVDAQATGRQPEIKREWLKGVRLQAHGDLQLAAYFRAYANGEESAANLHTALTSLDYGDGLTGWAFNALTGNPGPLPKRPHVS